MKPIGVICDDTDAFVLLAYFYQILTSHANVSMQATNGEQNIVDMDLSVKPSKEIIPSIRAAHAASDCDIWHHIMM